MKKMIAVLILLCGIMQGAFAQNLEIKGIIKDTNKGEALEFVNIVLQTKDSTFVKGTTSDMKGSFTLNQVKPGDYLLALSSLGYKTQYVTIENFIKSISFNGLSLEEESVSLANVTVSGSNMVSKSDRKMVFPSENQVKASTNGVNLLQQMMLPRLKINPMDNSISVPGGGEVQLRINGAKVETQEILALQPAEIIRIEYHDNPGLRYGNAEVVLDYIVRRPETGGSFGIDLQDAFQYEFGNNHVNGKVNHKKSEFSANYGVGHRNFYKMWRDNEETFTFPNGDKLERKEVGDPGHAQMLWQYMNSTYSFKDGDKQMFNATLRYYSNNQSHWDYNGTLYNVKYPQDAVRMIDNSAEKMHRPALDLYYMRNLKNDQTLVFNAVGTYHNTSSNRFYQESKNDILLTDINNKVDGNKYSIIGEGIYEKRLGEYRLSAGIKHTQSFSGNEYKNGKNYTSKMNQSESFAYTEFKGKVKKLDYTLGVGVTRSWFGTVGDGDGYSNYTFNPKMVLFYPINDQSSIRLKADLSNSAPFLSNLSAIDQVIDSLQIQRGNPTLRPYRRYRTELTYEFKKGIFYSNLWGLYEYQPKAIMDEKHWEGDKIIQTWNNQKNWQRLSSRLSLRVGPIKDILQISLEGGANHYISNGNTYSHTYTNWFTNSSISATYKKMMLILGIDTNWNWFYGETMTGGENIHYIVIKYNHKNLSLGVGAFNPFIDNYKQQTENRSEYASYKRSNYIKESSRLVSLSLTYNFSFGRKFNAGQKRVNNTDSDSGVMSSGK